MSADTASQVDGNENDAASIVAEKSWSLPPRSILDEPLFAPLSLQASMPFKTSKIKKKESEAEVHVESVVTPSRPVLPVHHQSVPNPRHARLFEGLEAPPSDHHHRFGNGRIKTESQPPAFKHHKLHQSRIMPDDYVLHKKNGQTVRLNTVAPIRPRQLKIEDTGSPLYLSQPDQPLQPHTSAVLPSTPKWKTSRVSTSGNGVNPELSARSVKENFQQSLLPPFSPPPSAPFPFVQLSSQTIQRLLLAAFPGLPPSFLQALASTARSNMATPFPPTDQPWFHHQPPPNTTGVPTFSSNNPYANFYPSLNNSAFPQQSAAHPYPQGQYDQFVYAEQQVPHQQPVHPPQPPPPPPHQPAPNQPAPGLNIDSNQLGHLLTALLSQNNMQPLRIG
ncbi:hypothetical protein BJ508DRAFT_334374 [Ascobolus immersus RN42]|uniref:Uncharacterized protein n=1 Tax=Ascobolus immersus RN42 TaxID=1160509 RepID=A0A3N4HG80_ASCIM|nr:hypothetical protein BJ508DRAFT_334374 [Ascobolus immersus RN42]